MADVIVVGGGLAGLAAAAALGGTGHKVRVLEARPFLGGRATSYEHGGDTIDNCQHILLKCCINLLDFYRRLGVSDAITFHREFHFIEPGGRRSVLKRGILPAPLHFTGSFLGLDFLSFPEKMAVARALRAIQRDREDLDQITMRQWLEEHRQPPRAIERFWRQILVSAINEELDRMSAAHAFLVFRLGFLATNDSYEMGVPSVPLTQLYAKDAWQRVGNVELLLRTPADRILVENGQVRAVQAAGAEFTADHYICAVPFERIGPIVPDLRLDVSAFSHSPITGVHLWFDRSVTDLPHATLLDRTIQWMYNKQDGRYLQLVVSASHSLVEMPRERIIELALRELAEFFPQVNTATLEKGHVVKEIRATFSAVPGLEAHRPPQSTAIPNLFLAGDWTRSGWPSTMEGAIRSGYLAAEAVTHALGKPMTFLRRLA